MGRLDRETQDDPRRRFNHENRRGPVGPPPTLPPATAAPGYRRVYLRSLTRVVNCDGPCKAGPEYCDCGLLWHDVPIAPKPQ